MPNATLRVLLVDDHEIVRRGLRAVLTEPGVEIVGEAGTVRDGVACAQQLRPRVVTMDLRLPDRSGIEACREIRATVPDARVLILTSYTDDDALFSAIMAGAAGYMLKDLDPNNLKGAVRSVAQGGSLIDPTLAATLRSRLRKRADGGPVADTLSPLTAQEDRILDFIADGLTNREVGEPCTSPRRRSRTTSRKSTQSSTLSAVPSARDRASPSQDMTRAGCRHLATNVAHALVIRPNPFAVTNRANAQSGGRFLNRSTVAGARVS